MVVYTSIALQTLAGLGAILNFIPIQPVFHRLSEPLLPVGFANLSSSASDRKYPVKCNFWTSGPPFGNDSFLIEASSQFFLVLLV